MQIVGLHRGKYPEAGLLFAVPNGGERNTIVGARMKAEGVKRGVPDYVLPVARGGFHGLAIELKAKGGRVSPEQRQWLDALRAQGWAAYVAWGADQAWDIVRKYLGGEYRRDEDAA
jgi:hypothetical protein